MRHSRSSGFLHETIRLATPIDIAAVGNCADRAFAVTGEPVACRSIGHDGSLATQIRAGAVYVIAESTRVLAYISFSPIADHVFVDTVAVLPGHHGRGLGSRLLALAEHHAGILGLRSVKLFTADSVAGDTGFYRRRGYAETGRYEEVNFSRVFYSKTILVRKYGRDTK